ncbi:hypothetical protein OV079_46005 [Nannocystis pusilla]|uniref:Uncharacterized protein n=1 Tax=Nannocystis pusilla TaxID=889268 RepID=A0A9X3EYT7_9BACT|nr:hypothetical protein [Nannocystis pusilla]MCY1012772.1 hypothetical protein [Nannocystis pusilla]
MDLTPDSDDPSPEVTWAVRLQASRLVVREPNKREVPYPLDGKAFRLGRADDNRIVVKAEFVAAHQRGSSRPASATATASVTSAARAA